MHDDLWSGRVYVLNEDLVCAFEENIRENRRFTITSGSLHFPQISLSLLHRIVSDKVKFRKIVYTLSAEDAYKRTEIETAYQYI